MPRSSFGNSGFDQRAIRSDGHAAASDAAQFAPFAALRGLSELLDERTQDNQAEPRHSLTEEEAAAMSETVLSLRRGDVVRCQVYDGRRYVAVLGTVTRIDLVEREIRIDDRPVRLDDLRWIERV
ncbi:MAG: hypothetical protein ACOYJL_06375 [Tractidigestivibacter sp.]|jgi:hypothetical protein|uniref:hypothetical protein n=1 Tax=Tractidigestivibacter sp. TaxID=2847320 RepID=UPI003D8F157F